MMLRDEQFDPETVSNSPAGVDADTNIYVTPGAARPVTIQTSNGTEIRPIPGAPPIIISPVAVPAQPAPGPGSSPIAPNAYGTTYTGTTAPAPGQPVAGNPAGAPISATAYGTPPNGTATTNNYGQSMPASSAGAPITATSYVQPGQINPGVVNSNGSNGQPQQLNPANGYGTVYTGSTTATTSYNGVAQPSQGNAGNTRGYGANQATPMPGNNAGPGTITMNSYGQPVSGNPGYGAANNGYGNATVPQNNTAQPMQGNPANGTKYGYTQPQSPIPANGGAYANPATGASPTNAYGQSVANNPANGPVYGQPQSPVPAAGVNPTNTYVQPVSGNSGYGAANNGYGNNAIPTNTIVQPANGAVYVYGPPQQPISSAGVNPANYGQPAPGNPGYGAVNNGYGNTTVPAYTATQPIQGYPANSPVYGYNQPQQPTPAYGAAYTNPAAGVNPTNTYAQPASGYYGANSANGSGNSQPPVPVNGYVQQQPIPTQGNASPIPAESYGTVYSGSSNTTAPAPATYTRGFTVPAQTEQSSPGAQQGTYTPNGVSQGATTASNNGSPQGNPNGAYNYVPAANSNPAPTYITNYGIPAAQSAPANTATGAPKQDAPIPTDAYGAYYTNTGTVNPTNSRPNAPDEGNVAYGTPPGDPSPRQARPRSAEAVVEGEPEPIPRKPRPLSENAVVENSGQENTSSRNSASEPTTTSSTRTITTTDTNPQDYETERLTRKTTTQQTTTQKMGGSKIEKHTSVNWGGIAKGVAVIAAVVVVGVGVYFGASALTGAAIHSPTFGPMIQGAVDMITPALSAVRDGVSWGLGYLSGVKDIIFGAGASGAAATIPAATVPTPTVPVAAVPTVAPTPPSVVANAGVTSKMVGWLFGGGAAASIFSHITVPTIEHTHALNNTEQLVTNTPVVETKTIVENIPEVVHHPDHSASTAAEMSLQAHELDHHLHHADHSNALADASYNTHHRHSDNGDLSIDNNDISAPDPDVDEGMLKKIESRDKSWRSRASSNHFSDTLTKSGSYRNAVEANRGESKPVLPQDNYVAELAAERDALGEASRV